MTLLFALSTPAWTGLAAVGGALTGATAGGFVEWGLEKARNKKLAKAGARLVAGEFAFADSSLADIEDGGTHSRFYLFPTGSWPEYREALALALSTEDFAAVAQAALDVQVVVNGDRLNETIDRDQMALRVRVVREDLAAGYNALAGLAKYEPVGKTIQPLTERSAKSG